MGMIFCTWPADSPRLHTRMSTRGSVHGGRAQEATSAKIRRDDAEARTTNGTLPRSRVIARHVEPYVRTYGNAQFTSVRREGSLLASLAS